jgi:hypothetical protein
MEFVSSEYVLYAAAKQVVDRAQKYESPPPETVS